MTWLSIGDVPHYQKRLSNAIYVSIFEVYWCPLTTSSVTKSTQLQRAIFFPQNGTLLIHINVLKVWIRVPLIASTTNKIKFLVVSATQRINEISLCLDMNVVLVLTSSVRKIKLVAHPRFREKKTHPPSVVLEPNSDCMKAKANALLRISSFWNKYIHYFCTTTPSHGMLILGKSFRDIFKINLL